MGGGGGRGPAGTDGALWAGPPAAPVAQPLRAGGHIDIW